MLPLRYPGFGSSYSQHHLFQDNYNFNEIKFKGKAKQGGKYDSQQQLKRALENTLENGISRAHQNMSMSFCRPDPKSKTGAKGLPKLNNYVDAFRADRALQKASPQFQNTLFITALEVFQRPSVKLNEQQQIKRDRDKTFAVEAYKKLKKDSRLSLNEDTRVKKGKEKLNAKKLLEWN